MSIVRGPGQEDVSGKSTTGARFICNAHLLLEAVKLHDFGASLQNLQLVALGGSTPLCAGNIASLQGDCLAAPSRLPTQTSIRETTFAVLLRKVQVDIVEALHFESPSARESLIVMEVRSLLATCGGGYFRDGLEREIVGGDFGAGLSDGALASRLRNGGKEGTR